MDAVLPWADLLQPILRHYPKPGHGRRPIPAATMLRIYFMQQWYGLSDPAMEDSLYDVASMRRFAGVGLDAIPDETTICTFRHFLEHHALTEVLFERTGAYLSDRGLLVHAGTIVDATIVAAPTSTKWELIKTKLDQRFLIKERLNAVKRPAAPYRQSVPRQLAVANSLGHDGILA